MLPAPRLLRSRTARIAGIGLALCALAATPGLAAGISVHIVGHPAPNTTSTSATFVWSRAGTISRTLCKLDGGSFVACTTSKSYSGLAEGSHTFTVRVEGGGAAAIDTFSWKVDHTAPTAPTSVGGGSLTWVRTNVSLTAAGGTDVGGSGVKGYQHRTSTNGGSTWTTPAGGNPFAVSAAGESITQFRTIDNAGNVSAWFPAVAGASNTARIDKVAPTVPALTGSSSAWVDAASGQITAAGSTDALSGLDHYQYRTSTTNGTSWSAGTDGNAASTSFEGQTTVEFRAVDAAGNGSAWATGTIRLDRTAPTAPTVTGGGAVWQGTDTVSVSATGSTDAGARTVHYEYETSSDNGAHWSAPTTGSKATIATEGITLVQFRAVDPASHVSPWTQTSVRLDTTDPTAPTVSGGSSAWQNIAKVTVTASGSTDVPGSGLLGYQFRTSKDGGATWSFPQNGSSVPITAAGQTLFQFRSTDNAGRHSAWVPASPTAGSTVRIDRTAPTAPSLTNSSTAWKDVASVTVTPSSSDGTGWVAGVTSYEYQLSTDGGSTWTVAAAGTPVVVSAEGETLVRYSALDGAGNRSGWTTATVRIDRTAPTAPTSLANGSLSWRSLASVTLTASGATDSPGSGVAGYEFRTSTNGGSTWSAASSAAATVSAEGETVVQMRAVDVYGHVSSWFPSTPVAASTVRLDRTLPVAPSVSGGSLSWQDVASVQITASGGSDALSGFAGLQYATSTNGGSSWSFPASGTSLLVTAEGETLVRFRSVDNAGNRSAWVPASFPSANGTVRIDRSAPSAPGLSNTGSSWSTTSPVLVASTAVDPYSGVASYAYQTSTDGGSTWSAPVAGSSATISAQGDTLVRFTATDALGHVSVQGQGTVRIDTVAPTAPTVSGGSLTCAVSRTISASGSTDATSGLSGYQYRVSSNNGSTWGSPVSGPSVTLSTTGTYIVQFRSVDAAGLTSAWAPASPGAASTACIT